MIQRIQRESLARERRPSPGGCLERSQGLGERQQGGHSAQRFVRQSQAGTGELELLGLLVPGQAVWRTGGGGGIHSNMLLFCN